MKLGKVSQGGSTPGAPRAGYESVVATHGATF